MCVDVSGRGVSVRVSVVVCVDVSGRSVSVSVVCVWRCCDSGDVVCVCGGVVTVEMSSVCVEVTGQWRCLCVWRCCDSGDVVCV